MRNATHLAEMRERSDASTSAAPVSAAVWAPVLLSLLIIYLLRLLFKARARNGCRQTVDEFMQKQQLAALTQQPKQSTTAVDLRPIVESLLRVAPTTPTPLSVSSHDCRVLPANIAAVQQLRSELKQAALSEEAAAHMDVFTLARFYLAVPASTKNRVAAAALAFRKAMDWRVDNRINDLLTELHPAILQGDAARLSRRQAAVRQHGYAGIGGVTPNGVPYVVERLGIADFAGLSEPTLHQLMREAYMAHLELLHRCVRACSAATGSLVYALVVVDMRGVGFNLLRNLELTKYAATAGSANFPEGTHRVLLVNAPRLVATLWGLVSPLLPESTRNKVSILGEAASRAALAEAVDPDELPAFLGGRRPDAATAVPLALPVPAAMGGVDAAPGGAASGAPSKSLAPGCYAPSPSGFVRLPDARPSAEPDLGFCAVS